MVVELLGLGRLVHKELQVMLDAGLFSLNHLEIPQFSKGYGGAVSTKLHSRVLMLEVHSARVGSEE